MLRANESRIIDDLTRMAKAGANRKEILTRAKLSVTEEKAENFLKEVIKAL
jgi:hypothetical protein